MREGGRECLRSPYRESDARQIAGFFFLCVCDAVLESEVGWEEPIERYDLGKSGNGSMSFRLYFHATDKT